MFAEFKIDIEVIYYQRTIKVGKVNKCRIKRILSLK